MQVHACVEIMVTYKQLHGKMLKLNFGEFRKIVLLNKIITEISLMCQSSSLLAVITSISFALILAL